MLKHVETSGFFCGLPRHGNDEASDGLSVSFSGFNEHLAQLQQLVLPKLREPQAAAIFFPALA
jgi:hypothetical protein